MLTLLGNIGKKGMYWINLALPVTQEKIILVGGGGVYDVGPKLSPLALCWVKFTWASFSATASSVFFFWSCFTLGYLTVANLCAAMNIRSILDRMWIRIRTNKMRRDIYLPSEDFIPEKISQINVLHIYNALFDLN
jgi:hypothetical protein